MHAPTVTLNSFVGANHQAINKANIGKLVELLKMDTDHCWATLRRLGHKGLRGERGLLYLIAGLTFLSSFRLVVEAVYT
jgi:hypothetical protein